jgi:uncharacterized protein YbaR (Trm112 family)
MGCPVCKSPLMVSNSKFESEVGSTDVFNVLTMVCINPKCPNYAGSDLNNPAKAETIRNKVN